MTTPAHREETKIEHDRRVAEHERQLKEARKPQKMPVFEGVKRTEDMDIVKNAIPRITQTTTVELGADGLPLKHVAQEAGRVVSREEVHEQDQGLDKGSTDAVKKAHDAAATEKGGTTKK